MTEPASAPTPLDVWVAAIRVAADRRALSVDFTLDDGVQVETARLSAEYLRVESPSAEVQGHGPGQKQLVTGKSGVMIETLDPVGHYAVRIGFSDGHKTGLYTWETLHRLARDHDHHWPAYIDAVSAAGKSR